MWCFEGKFFERDINTQLPLCRYQSKDNPFAVLKKCPYCNNGTLYSLIDSLHFKGVPTDNLRLTPRSHPVYLNMVNWHPVHTKQQEKLLRMLTCCGLCNYLWLGTCMWLVRQKLVHFVEESRLLLWCGISCFGAFIFVASVGAYQCEFVSCSFRRLCLLSLQLEDVPQCLAIWAVFLHKETRLFKNTRVSLCSHTLPRVFVSAAILNVSY